MEKFIIILPYQFIFFLFNLTVNVEQFVMFLYHQLSACHVRHLPPFIYRTLSWEHWFPFKEHKIEIFFGFDFEICTISLLAMSKY